MGWAKRCNHHRNRLLQRTQVWPTRAAPLRRVVLVLASWWWVGVVMRTAIALATRAATVVHSNEPEQAARKKPRTESPDVRASQLHATRKTTVHELVSPPVLYWHRALQTRRGQRQRQRTDRTVARDVRAGSDRLTDSRLIHRMMRRTTRTINIAMIRDPPQQQQSMIDCRCGDCSCHSLDRIPQAQTFRSDANRSESDDPQSVRYDSGPEHATIHTTIAKVY